MVSLLDFCGLFGYRQTQNTVLSGGALVGWHWEHLWLKGKRTGVEGSGQRTEDTDRRRTNTSLCPSMADGDGQTCSILPGEPVDETKCCRKEHRKASRVEGPFNFSCQILQMLHRVKDITYLNISDFVQIHIFTWNVFNSNWFDVELPPFITLFQVFLYPTIR